MYRSQCVCTLSIIIIKHQCPKTILKSCNRSHACIYNSKYFVQSENLFPYIFTDRVLFDFWCALDNLQINLLENDFSSKSGIFCMRHCDGYVQKDIVVSKKKKKKKIRFLFGFSLFLPNFRHREF